MTADGTEEPGRPKRKRRRRRRPRPGTVDGAARSEASAGGKQPAKASPGDERSASRSSRAKAGGPKAGGAKAGGPKAGGAKAKGAKAKGARSKGSKAKATQAAKRSPAPKRSGSKSSARRSPRRSRTSTKEVSAGGVVYRRREDGAIELLLASRRTRRGDLAWGLAKGGIEADETPEQAAVREVWEETGIVAEIEENLGETKYFYVWEEVRIRKTVHFFLMRATGGDTEHRDDEMEEVRWFPLARGMKRAAYRGEREMLAKAADLLR
jgi:8-oxo-dGTP pyrophosphatase MutT (NUDIX family)